MKVVKENGKIVIEIDIEGNDYRQKQKRKKFDDGVNYRLKKLINYLGLNPKQVAKDLGISTSTLYNYLNGCQNVKDYFLMAIAYRYGVSYTWLKYGIGKVFDQKKINRDKHMENPIQEKLDEAIKALLNLKTMIE